MDIKGILTGAAVAAVFGAAGYFTAVNMDQQPASPAGEPVQIGSLNETQKDEVRALVRDTLVSNPEILEEVSVALEKKRADEEAERRKETIAAQKDLIFSSADDHAAGNPAGDVTIVEFFDYNCPYCKRALGDISALLEADPNVKVVFKEFPILGEASRLAARAALAARAQDGYFAFHKALMQADISFSEPEIMAVAESVGLDTARLKADMADPEIDAYLAETDALARELGIGGTPAFVIDGTLYPGALDAGDFDQLVARSRQG